MALFGRESERDQARAANYAAWFARQHPLALPSIVLSAFSLTHMGLLLLDELAGITFGFIAVMQIQRAGKVLADSARPLRREGLWLAVAGIVMGVASLILALAIYSTPHRG